VTAVIVVATPGLIDNQATQTIKVEQLWWTPVLSSATIYLVVLAAMIERIEFAEVHRTQAVSTRSSSRSSPPAW
jgi:hypothetical protein